jgi:MATE family multidrug resistance protein
MHAQYATRSAWRFSWQHWKDLWRLGWPGGAMFGNEMVCWAFFMVYLVSHFGPQHATAGWIAHQYMSLSFMPAVGLSVACTALVGKYQGMQRSDLAVHRAWLAIRLALVYMGLCGLAFFFFREQLIRFFLRGDTPPEQVEEIIRLGSKFLIATAAFQLFDAVAMTVSGALRGAGDTVVPGVATVVLSWTIIVGGGLALTKWAPHLESLGAWIAAASYIALLCLFLLARFLSGKWKSIRVVDDPVA